MLNKKFSGNFQVNKLFSMKWIFAKQVEEAVFVGVQMRFADLQKPYS